jgi:hypothetical protein
VGLSIEEFNNVFCQCSTCTNITVTANAKYHLCMDSIPTHSFSKGLHRSATGIKHQRCPNRFTESPPTKGASTLVELRSREGVSAHKFGKLLSVCTRCNFCMTQTAAEYHSCSLAF